MSNADFLLHPIRLRLIQAFLGGRELTTGQLRELLPEIPPASLYRQVAKLVEGGALELVSERRTRGAKERTYRLQVAAATVPAEQVAEMDAASHRRAFTTFIATLLGDFERYLARDRIDPAQDGVGYRQVVLNLSDAELALLAAELSTAIGQRMALPPGPGRRRRQLSTIVMPAG